MLLLACAALAFSACSGGSHDAGNAGKTGDGGGRNRVERATTGIGAAGRRTVVVTPPRTREVLGDLRVPALHHRTAIVLVHGGGGFLGDRGEEHAWQDLYSHSGYITLSADYFIVPEEEIKRLESVLTIVDGKIVHGAGHFGPLAPPPLPVLPDWSPVKEYGGYFRSRQGVETPAHAGLNLHALLHRLFGQHDPNCREPFWGLGCECFAF